MKLACRAIFWMIMSIFICQMALAFNPTPTNEVEKFLSVADIHFNPFASCTVFTLKPCPLVMQLRQAKYQDWEKIFEQSDSKTPSAYHEDTNYALLKSTLIKLKAVDQAENPRFALLLGDFLAHNFPQQYILYSHDHTVSGYRSFVKKTLQFLTAEIREAIPLGDIYPAVGNNDSYTGDYSVIMRGQFFQDTKNTWSSLIKTKANQESFQRDFPLGGYYAVTVPNAKNQLIIVLDTVAFSIKAQGKDVQQLAQTEMDWLHKQLKLAAQQHQSVMLAFHIPVGIDVYATVKRFLGGIIEFWQPVYSTVFRSDLSEFADIITAILPAHIHMDTFQVVVFKHPQDIPVSFTPSISPIFGNNPGFKVYSYYSQTFRLSNFDTYYYPLDQDVKTRDWQVEYNFNRIYQSKCSQCEISHGMLELTPANLLADYFKQYYVVGGRGKLLKDKKWLPFYWCDIHAISKQDYQMCIQQ